MNAQSKRKRSGKCSGSVAEVFRKRLTVLGRSPAAPPTLPERYLTVDPSLAGRFLDTPGLKCFPDASPTLPVSRHFDFADALPLE